MKNVYIVRKGDSADVRHGERVEKGFALMYAGQPISADARLSEEYRHHVSMQALSLVMDKVPTPAAGVMRAPRAVWLEVLPGGAA